MAEKKISSAVGEKEVTRAIVNEFAKQFSEYVESDCRSRACGFNGRQGISKREIKSFNC
jgi:ribulose 1,5-bisphosphate synthetase/thiazole synthase